MGLAYWALVGTIRAFHEFGGPKLSSGGSCIICAGRLARGRDGFIERSAPRTARRVADLSACGAAFGVPVAFRRVASWLRGRVCEHFADALRETSANGSSLGVNYWERATNT